VEIAIIGGGPAGLRAAEVAAAGGAAVTLFDAKASVGRKFLVAGRGGMNLTNAEPKDQFIERYSGPSDRWPELLADFDADALRAWAAGLDVETFAASTGRVYPRALKAAPLLRRWVQRLKQLGVSFAMHHRWTALRPGPRRQIDFQTEAGIHTRETDAVILALGGGSWPETGSDGSWVSILSALGIGTTPLAPANCGWEYPWPTEVRAVAEGQPLKSIAVRAGSTEAKGELMITGYGLEGGAIYQLGPQLRAMAEPELHIDFKPSNTVAQLVAKMGPIQRNFLAEARSRWRLNDAVHAILSQVATGANCTSAEALATLVKNCPLRLTGPRPIAEAISSAGGVHWDELDRQLMLEKLPGVFVAGEMIDWEAPTGGFLLQGCFATGSRAAQGALRWTADAS
jgi:uncharacterized flavoprotein (TIGR03862 family)